ncbi:MAG: pyrroloquinoline-quinone synthase PqqC [Granulosicoccus sp.]|nr:pyrroloquinoline-quinone synthase PqqC [Granulosicoccus sp.]
MAIHTTPWDKKEFEERLRAEGKAYHIYHPYNVMLNDGHASQAQIQGWVANRFYYQQAIPLKDAAVLSNCDDREVRREWIQRILDHDGYQIGDQTDRGGIEAWVELGLAVGLTREEVTDLRHVLPGVKFAVDAYINFAKTRPWQESVCASLTELFAPAIHKQRLSTWPEHYPWIDSTGLQYFRNRVSQARRDVEHGLAVTLDYFDTPKLQQRALDILRFKLDILWQISDAMADRYGLPDRQPLPTLAEQTGEPEADAASTGKKQAATESNAE